MILGSKHINYLSSVGCSYF